MSGQLRRNDILHLALQGFKEAEFLTTAPFYNSLLAAAGHLQDPDLIYAAWRGLYHGASNQGHGPSLISWRTLARAAKLTGLEKYVADQIELFGNKISVEVPREIEKVLKGPSAPLRDISRSISDSDSLAGDEQHRGSIRGFCDETGALLTRLDEVQSAPAFASLQKSIWNWPTHSNEQWEREFYDEISLESPANAASTEGISKAIPSKDHRIITYKSTTSPTGISLGELRYLNSKSISSLLIQAEVWETKKNKSEHEAEISENFENQCRGQDLTNRRKRPDHWKQIIAHRMDLKEEASKHETKEQWLARVRNLRGGTTGGYRPPPSLR